MGVIVLGEVGFLFWSGRLPAIFSRGTEMMTQVQSNVQPLSQQDLPVHVVMPPSFGAVTPQLQNSSANPFTLRVTVRRPGTDQHHEWVIELEPNQTLSLARRGGWTFADGDELELVQDGYRPKKVRLQ